jgi:hypothetical protein
MGLKNINIIKFCFFKKTTKLLKLLQIIVEDDNILQVCLY